MTALPYTWDGESFRIRPSFQKRADELFCVGETYTLEVLEERSAASHRHYFAAVNEAWANLPEHLAEQYPTADHLRKGALIRAGYRDERSIVCASRAEALRVAGFVKPLDTYALVTVTEAVVRVFTAQSQSQKAMGKQLFLKSKADVLETLADMIGVQTAALHEHARAA